MVSKVVTELEIIIPGQVLVIVSSLSICRVRLLDHLTVNEQVAVIYLVGIEESPITELTW